MTTLKQYPEWREAACEASQLFDYGDIISIEWLRDAFDLQIPEYGTSKDYSDHQLKFLSQLDRFRDALLTDHKKYLQNVRGKGYLVCAVEDQTAAVWGDMVRKVKKAMAATHKGLTCIDHQQLSAAGLASNNNKLALLSSLSVFARKNVFVEMKDENGQGSDVSSRKQICISNKTPCASGASGSQEEKRSAGV